MARALVVLIGFVYNPLSIVKDRETVDPRYEVLSRVATELRRRGHGVMVLTEGHGAYKRRKPYVLLRDREFGEWPSSGRENAAARTTPDCAVVWWATVEQGLAALPAHTPTVVYENGFTRGDVVVDPGGLLGRSHYLRTLNARVQEAYDDAACRVFIATRVRAGHWSKRPQGDGVNNNDVPADVPAAILGTYVFVPTQKSNDLSVAKFSNITLFALLEQAAMFCTERRVPLVVKIHPHVDDAERALQTTFLERLRRGEDASSSSSLLYLSTAPIDALMRNARLTLTLNGGTIVDNLYTETPVLTTALSLFALTDAVLYDPANVTRGLQQAVDAELPWSDARRLRQRQVVCWLARRSLNVDKSAQENIDVLQAHLQELNASIDLGDVDVGPRYESHPLPEKYRYRVGGEPHHPQRALLQRPQRGRRRRRVI